LGSHPGGLLLFHFEPFGSVCTNLDADHRAEFGLAFAGLLVALSILFLPDGAAGPVIF
jgi:hypothetical protein